MLSPDGNTLYFNYYGESVLLGMTWQADHWSDPKPILAEGKSIVGLRPSISSDGQWMAMVAWNREYRDLPNYGAADIYVTRCKDGVWQPVRSAGPKVNRFNEEMGVAFVPGTHTLCYSCDAPGSECGLWLAEQEGEQWGEPRPLRVDRFLRRGTMFQPRRQADLLLFRPQGFVSASTIFG